MRLKVLIVDDEPLAREGLRRMLEGDPHVEAIGEARNGREALAAIRDRRPDLVLLDIQMPRMDGFAVVEAVGADRMPSVIFVTAYDQYAIRAFEISAVDYLLKPVTEERFRLAFTRVTERLRSVTSEECARQMLTVLDAIAHPPRRLERLAVRSGEKTLFLSVESIDRIEACQNYVQLRAGQTSHLLHVPDEHDRGVARSRCLRPHSSLAHRQRPADQAGLVRRARPVRRRIALRRAPAVGTNVWRSDSRTAVESLLNARRRGGQAGNFWIERHDRPELATRYNWCPESSRNRIGWEAQCAE